MSRMATPGKEKGERPAGISKLLLIAGLVLILDQATKLLIVKTLPLGGEIPVIPGCFSIVHVLNPGGAFGFLAGAGELVRRFFFIGVSVLAMGLIYYFYRTTPGRYGWLSSAFAMIFGGAIGNLVDRLRFGLVVDFLDVYAGAWHWPAFNVADSAITIGIAIFVFHVLFGKMPGEQPKR